MNKQYALTIDFNKEGGAQGYKTTAINEAAKTVSTTRKANQIHPATKTPPARHQGTETQKEEQ